MASNKRNESLDTMNASSDSEEDELLEQAASQWAASKSTKDTAADTSSPQQDDKPKSLHVTQLSFQATDYDIRSLFVEKGCNVTSVRLVYDYPYSGSSEGKTFRGVAFVDVADETSFQQALKLNRSYLLGRRINVRPTRSKSELASIVETTKRKVAEQMSQRKQQQNKGESNTTNKKRNDNPQKKGSKDTSVHKKRASKKFKQSRPSKGSHKLTKKERNRRAAIIMSKKRGKK